MAGVAAGGGVVWEVSLGLVVLVLSAGRASTPAARKATITSAESCQMWSDCKICECEANCAQTLGYLQKFGMGSK